jgi:anhydro-N-acetylmuramic acid kinase
MSGTSLDGVDAALVEVTNTKCELLDFQSDPYPAKLRERLSAVSNRECHTRDIARLHFELPSYYARAVRKLSGRAELAGCHGQTIYHEGRRATLQIGDGAVLARELGIPVVSDFRTADIAAGGEGAPLVPFLDYRLLRHRTLGRVALNLGGIANVTAIPPGAALDRLTAFDTGPANMAIDGMVSRVTKGRSKFDKDGKIAVSGKVDAELLARLLRDPYLKRKPPKSCGREQYGAEFLDRLPVSVDTVATLTAFSAVAVAQGIDRFVKPRMPVQELIASGGGVHNPQLMAYLSAYLPGVRIRTIDEFGVSSDAKEAVAFAVMAYETWKRRPSNVPSATGARKAAILGKLSY